MSIPKSHDNIPSHLYRVNHSLQHTTFDPVTGLVASSQDLTSPSPTSTSNSASSSSPPPQPPPPSFPTLVRNHRSQTSFPTPFISLFSSLEEAESWCIAAEEFTGHESHVLSVDVAAWMKLAGQKKAGAGAGRAWEVARLAEKIPGLQDLMNGGGGAKSEWLALYNIPGKVIKMLKNGSRVRRERAWDPVNSLCIPYGGTRILDHDESVPVDEKDLIERFQRKKWIIWNKCDCANEETCEHLEFGGFEKPEDYEEGDQSSMWGDVFEKQS